MSLFNKREDIERRANICHLIVSGISDKELQSPYGYTLNEIYEAKSYINKFDDAEYLRGNLRKAFKRK